MLKGFLRAAGVYRAYEKWLMNQVKRGDKPHHVAVILDGNRRWAAERFVPFFNGHEYGAVAGENLLEWCLDLGIETVTLYVFSTENFQRPPHEVEKIFSLIEEEAKKLGNDPRIHQNRVRVKAIGNLALLPEDLRRRLVEIEEATEHYDQHYLNIAVAYGGRAEVVDAAKRIAEHVKLGKLSPSDINEELFGNYLYTAHLPNPDPDLIIRTSGEERLSGFLLWQAAYSELCFLDVYWPEFRKIDLLRALRTFQTRRRNFGH